MTRLGHVQFTLCLLMLVAFAAAPDSVDAGRGSIIAVRALPDGTALVGWHGDAADYVTHVRADGTLLGAQLAHERIDAVQFEGDLDLDEPAENRGSYKGRPVVLRDNEIDIGGTAHPLPGTTMTHLIPARLQPIAGELPQFVGIANEGGPMVLDLDTAAVVWRGEPHLADMLRDGASVYELDGSVVRVFDPMTFSMNVVARDVRTPQIAGGYVWTYERDTAFVDAPIVHAIQPAPGARITALR